jgi:hypothetical protein
MGNGNSRINQNPHMAAIVSQLSRKPGIKYPAKPTSITTASANQPANRQPKLMVGIFCVSGAEGDVDIQ